MEDATLFRKNAFSHNWETVFGITNRSVTGVREIRPQSVHLLCETKKQEHPGEKKKNNHLCYTDTSND